jgi:hypothetical protein
MSDTIDASEWFTVFICGQFDDVAYVATHPAVAPDIHNYRVYTRRDMVEIDLRLNGQPCTAESKEVFLEALRAWLQSRYDDGDRTYKGLEGFIKEARIKYLQPNVEV